LTFEQVAKAHLVQVKYMTKKWSWRGPRDEATGILPLQCMTGVW